jgi:energy-coupling factor transporter transmembrane protein EcfT
VSRRFSSRRLPAVALVADSPLRPFDPRVKLLLSLGASLAVMLPLVQLAAAIGLYVLLLAWARLLPPAARQVWRLKWVLLLIFIVDWLVVSLELAALVTLRITLLAGVFALFFATTTPDELRLVLEWLRVPHRYAFSVSLAFQSIFLLDQEWRAVQEAQRARGAWAPPTRWRQLRRSVEDMVALSVPAVVLAARRAWAMTEAAYARGFEAPHRRPYRRLAMRPADWALLAVTALLAGLFLAWRLRLLADLFG